MGAPSLWRRLRTGWRRADTVVHSTNAAVFLTLVANCRWGDPAVVLTACGAAVTAQAWAARRDAVLRRALYLGLALGAAWPLGEGIAVRWLGWWGAYLAPGPRIWDTPLYCVVIGALATTHCAFVGKRADELGYGLRGWSVMAGLSAFAIGALGENMFVWSGMWRYDETDWAIGAVPAFVPLAYGLAFAALPWMRRLSPLPQAAAFNALMFLLCAALGVATGFFPR